MKEKLILGINRYLVLNLVFLILLVFTRIYEYFYLKHVIAMPAGSYALELGGAFHDVLMLLNLSAWFLIPFLLLFLISKRTAIVISGVLIVLFILVEIALIQYLGVTSLLLGIDLFGYTFTEIIGIAAAGGGLSFTALLPVVFIVLMMITLLVLSKRIKPSYVLSLLFVILSFISLGYKRYTIPDAGKYTSELSFSLITNKAYHLFSATYLSLNPDEATEANLFNYFYTGLPVQDKSFEYISNEYPFLRKDDTPDMLGKYFNRGSEPPNLVFIIVESLARAYSGEGAYLNSFTPFLDSLSNQSLYWENVLSTSGRTFEVMPSIFGSMPYGKSGFAEMGDAMPDGMTLISLLKERGYKSRFFYGGDASFDNMRQFFDKQHIDEIIEEKDFGTTYTKMPPVKSGGFTWGYGEKDIFNKGFEILSNAGSQPRLDIYLTLAMHDPYRIPDQDDYNRRVEQRLNTFSLTEAQKTGYRKYLLNYASILYFDDALRSFFSQYQKREDYMNTIFFITGDHRMSSPPISTQIDRFHVPLIIFSPMLKSAEKFSSVVSHLDFTPSVVAFLKSKYGMKFPSLVPWLGQGFDSLATFRNTRSIPFIRTKSEIIDYLDREYFIVNDQLFKLSENMALVNMTDEKKQTEIQRKFDKFKTDNLKACYGNMLIPDSLKFRMQP